ncbi:unnamed protein product, partial [Mesorhabditis spiculigera]
MALVSNVPELTAIAPGGTEMIALSMIAAVCVLNSGLCALFTLHAVYILFGKRNHMSAKTKRLQQTFFLSLLVQLLVPFISLAAPWFWFIFAAIIKIEPILGSS